MGKERRIMHLRKKDMLFIGSISFMFIITAVLGRLFFDGIMLTVLLGIMLVVLTILHIECYRRITKHLKDESKRYLLMDITDVIQSRRSIRKFLDTPISQEHVEKMLRTAGTAPSAGQTQPWHFIVIRNREIIGMMERTIQDKIEELPKLCENCADFPKADIQRYVKNWKQSSLFFAKAPVTIAVLVEDIPNLYYEFYLQCIMAKGLSNLEARKRMGLVELQSVSAAAENLLLAAHSLGYGACWMRVPFMAKDDLMELLNVKAPWDLMALIPVGVPDPAYPPPKIKRKKFDETVTIL